MSLSFWLLLGYDLNLNSVMVVADLNLNSVIAAAAAPSPTLKTAALASLPSWPTSKWSGLIFYMIQQCEHKLCWNRTLHWVLRPHIMTKNCVHLYVSVIPKHVFRAGNHECRKMEPRTWQQGCSFKFRGQSYTALTCQESETITSSNCRFFRTLQPFLGW